MILKCEVFRDYSYDLHDAIAKWSKTLSDRISIVSVETLERQNFTSSIFLVVAVWYWHDDGQEPTPDACELDRLTAYLRNNGFHIAAIRADGQVTLLDEREDAFVYSLDELRKKL